MSKEGIKELILDGNRIHDIPSFYDEVNRVFMRGVDFTLGSSLDAFNDVLHGGYGAIRGNEPICLKWLHFEKNKEDLGNHRRTSQYPIGGLGARRLSGGGSFGCSLRKS